MNNVMAFVKITWCENFEFIFEFKVYSLKFEIVVRVEQFAITNTHFARSAAILKEWSFLKDNHFQFFNNKLTYKLRLFQLFSKFTVPFKQSEI